MKISHKTKKSGVSSLGSSAKFLLSSSALTVAGLALFAATPAFADTAPWSDFTDEHGTIAIDTSNSTQTNILQHSDIYVGRSGHLSIPEGYSVNIKQNSANSLFAAKASLDSDPTRILGALNANGRVLIVDRNGVFFGQNSQVDVGGLVATTGDVSNDQIINNAFGNYTFVNVDGNPDARIDLQGQVNVADSGLAAFVAPSVSHSGVINAKMGTVALASGNKVTMDPYGDNLFEIEVPSDVAARIENSGAIHAQGGVVQMTTSTAGHVVDNLINVDGLVDVSSASVQGGKIVLSAGKTGTVAVKGTLDATGKTGGTVTVTGKTVAALDGAVIEASGQQGGGDIKFGGAYQGQGETPKADYAYVDRNAVLRADATVEGDGGDVVVWSEVGTGFHGLITARGAGAGQGGTVETSGKDYLEADGSVVAGEWLLDPRNLAVVDTLNRDISLTLGLDLLVEPFNIINSVYSYVTDDVIEGALNAGTNVTLRTADYDTQQGDIVVMTQIDKTAGGDATLRMEAHDDVWLNEGIVSTAGKLAVELIAGAFGPTIGSQSVLVNGNVSTNGGNFYATGKNFSIAGINPSAVLDAQGGNILIENSKIFNSGAANTLRTSGTGTIELNQNKGGSIQKAIDAVKNTGTGLNTIHVGAGTFHESLTVSKNHFLLEGANAGISGNDARGAETIIAPASPGFFVTGDDVTIDGFTVTGADDGIYFLKGHDGVIRNNIITDSSKDGVRVVLSDRVKVYANLIQNALDDGIDVHNSSDVTIGGVDLADRNHIIGNGISGNNNNGIEAVVVDRIRIQNNLIDTPRWDGLNLKFGDDVLVFDNIVNGSIRSGLALKNTTNSYARVNTVNNAGTWGLYSDHNDGVDISFNTVNGTGRDGIFHQDAEGSATITYNTVDDAGWNGIYSKNSDDVSIFGNTINRAGQNGIEAEGGTNLIIGTDDVDGGNKINESGEDGIQVHDFGSAWIAYNIINQTGDDGIEALDGDFVAIYDNSVFDAGLTVDNGDESGADGIHVANVGGIDVIPPIADEEDSEGFGYGIAEADSQIWGNSVVFTRDDGIEVEDGNATYIYDNDVAHIGHDTWDADGIRVVDTDHTIVKHNRVSMTLDDGIRIKNGAYAGVFGNKVLLAGDDGIEVSGITWEGEYIPEIEFADVDYPSYGWPVNVEDNQVALTGDNGIYVHDSLATRIVNNDVSFAGLGEIVSEAVEAVGDLFLGEFPVLLALEDDSWDEYSDYDFFSFTWGDGDGIKVDNVYAESPILTLSLEDEEEDDEYDSSPSEWSVVIQGNDVAWTGGDGIDVSYSGRTLIGGYAEGEENRVYQAGIDWTSLSAYDFDEVLSEGPFAGEDRRTLWGDEDMTDLLRSYIVFDEIGHDTHDGITVSAVFDDGYFYGPGASGDGYYGYAVEIIGNDVNTTGDDGIEVAYSGSALIKDNTVMGAGIGGYDGSDMTESSPFDRVNYGAGDYYGADGIHVRGVQGESGIPAGIGYEDGFRDYAVVVDGNRVDGTADDGIEVIDSGRTRISNNFVTNAGIFGFGYAMDAKYSEESDSYEDTYHDEYGADGIHVRNVIDGGYGSSDEYDFIGELYNPEDWSVEIVGNTVGVLGDEEEPYVPGAADDGIQVLWSGNTLIQDNHVFHVGIGDIIEIPYYGDIDMWGADGIHVLAGFLEDTKPRGRYVSEESYSPYFLATTVHIIGNEVNTTGDDGIEVENVTDLLVDSNTVDNATDNGINIHATGGFSEEEDDLYFGEQEIDVGVIDSLPVFNSVVTNNIVTDSGTNGLYVEGTGHGSVIVSGNRFTDNPTGARFESGAVDISDAGNPNAFINTVLGFTPVGLLFDDLEGPSDNLTIVNETLGGTTFEGFQTAGSYYVYFTDGSILDPLTLEPIVIDGVDATFDGITPADTGGILSAVNRTFIEDRLNDADDALVNGRGQIFVGTVAADEGLAIDNVEDFFRQFSFFNPGTSGLNVTILGLPPVGGPFPPAFNLAGIQPAAGEEEGGVAGIEPAAGDEEGGNAGQNPQTGNAGLNAIEPAGQNEDTPCWGDAVNAAQNGASANFSFGGTLEESLADTISCQTTASAL